MAKIGMGELIIILIIALVVLGPEKLPQLGRSVGKAIRSVKKYVHEATQELGDMEDVREIQKDIQGIQQDIRSMGTSLERSVREDTKKLEDDMRAAERELNAAIEGPADPPKAAAEASPAAPAETEIPADNTTTKEEH